eukprot:scaffold84604_cov47-Attheya_sp.AAC.4
MLKSALTITARRPDQLWKRIAVAFRHNQVTFPTLGTNHYHTSSSKPSLRHFDWRNETVRYFSTTFTKKKIRIWFGSQTGTAQLFSLQLSEALTDAHPEMEVSVRGLNETASPADVVKEQDAIHVFLLSVAGVGEPTDNARTFYDWLMTDPSDLDWTQRNFAIFGLGNSKAHANQFNVIGKSVDNRLEKLGAQRFLPLGLGDDGDCIEDDFDKWMDQFLHVLEEDSHDTAITEEKNDKQTEEVENEGRVASKCTPTIEPQKQSLNSETCHNGQRRISSKYPILELSSPSDATCTPSRPDLFHLQQSSNPFYQSNTYRLPVISNRALSMGGSDSTMHELQLSLDIDDGKSVLRYTSGDHLIVYPRNSSSLVEAYLNILDVDPKAIIKGVENHDSMPQERIYPFPFGISVEETLVHCVDLGAVPSPSFARYLMGRHEFNYKEDIFNARRTPLELICEINITLSLEELLFQVAKMKPRYYSISSSHLAHPNTIYLTYRPVRYVNGRGALREGTCTRFLSDLVPVVMDEMENKVTSYPYVVAGIRSNPKFRLPSDPNIPIILIAGGCGVAPIRAFIEERMWLASHHDDPSDDDSQKCDRIHLFLGFRSPMDEVYRPMVDRAKASGVIADAQISYSTGCTQPEQNCALVSEVLAQQGELVYDLLEKKSAHIYLCGGARLFGAAIEGAIISIIQTQGNMNSQEATAYLRRLIREDRFLEDLAD